MDGPAHGLMANTQWLIDGCNFIQINKNEINDGAYSNDDGPPHMYMPF